MESKGKILVIINPKSGRFTAKSQLWAISDLFTKAGYQVTVYTTQKHGDATEWAKHLADKFDCVVCRGGDGTFNEVVNGIMQSGVSVPLGYIPSGTTNDFARSIGVPTNTREAIDLICRVEPKTYDLGFVKNNGMYFNYVASFGIFTKSTYTVPQKTKNILGYPAYILDGLKEIGSYKNPPLLRVTCDDEVYEGNYAFGAVSSSLYIAGGIIKYKPDEIGFDDGMLELNLATLPKGASQWLEVSRDLLVDHVYKEKFFTRSRGSHFVIECLEDTELAWTLDGEYGGTYKVTEIDCVKNAIKVYRS